jgi:hypothetical protein
VTLRDALRPILDVLLAQSEGALVVSLDALSDAIGTSAVSAEDVDALVEALEAAGRTVGAPSSPGPAADDLRKVLPAARTLAARLGRSPSMAELALASGVPVVRVRDALAFAALIARTAR